MAAIENTHQIQNQFQMNKKMNVKKKHCSNKKEQTANTHSCMKNLKNY